MEDDVKKILWTQALSLLACLLPFLAAAAQQPSPSGVKTLSPSGAIKPTGRLNQDDIVEVEGTFYAAQKR